MRPSNYIQQVCPTQRERLNLSFKALDFYLSAEDVKILVEKDKRIKKDKETHKNKCGRLKGG